MRFSLCLAVSLALALGARSASAQVTVSPIVSERLNETITIANSGSSALRLEATVGDFEQYGDGSHRILSPGESPHSCGGRLHVGSVPTQVGPEREVRIAVRVDPGAEACWSAILLRVSDGAGRGGMFVIKLYGIPVGATPEAEVTALSVTFRYDCPPDPSLVDMAQLYQSFWGEIGADVELRQVEQATHITEAISGEYEAKCFRAGLDRDPLPTLFDAFSPDSSINFTRFSDPSIDANLDALAASDDQAERQGLVEEISTTVNENFPMTYHGSTLSVLGARDVVKNLDGWTFPDGTEGSGIPGATTMWGFVWTTE